MKDYNNQTSTSNDHNQNQGSKGGQAGYDENKSENGSKEGTTKDNRQDQSGSKGGQASSHDLTDVEAEDSDISE